MKKQRIHFQNTEHDGVYTVHFSSLSQASSSACLDFLKKLPTLGELMRSVHPAEEQKSPSFPKNSYARSLEKKELLSEAISSAFSKETPEPEEREPAFSKAEDSSERIASTPKEDPWSIPKEAFASAEKTEPSGKRPGSPGDKIPPSKRTFFSTSFFTFLLILALATASVLAFQPVFSRYYDPAKLFHAFLSGSHQVDTLVVSQMASIQRKLVQENLLPPLPPAKEQSQKEESSQAPLAPPSSPEKAAAESSSASKETSGSETLSPDNSKTYDLPPYSGDSMVRQAENRRGFPVVHPDLYFYVTNAQGQVLDHYMLQSSFPNPGGSLFSLSLTTDAQANVSSVKSSSPLYQENLSSLDRHLPLQQRLGHSQVRLLPSAHYLFVIPEDYAKIHGLVQQNVESLAMGIMFNVIALAATALVFLLALFIPWSLQKNATVVQLFNHTWLEAKILFFILLLTVAFEPLSCVYDSGLRPLAMFINWQQTPLAPTPLFYAVGIPCAFIVLFLVYLLGTFFKYVVYSGFMEGLIKNSLMGQLLFWTGGAAKKSVRSLGRVLNRRTRSALLLLLGISSLLLFMGFVTFGFNLFHVFLLLLYFIFPYKVISHHLNNMDKLENYSYRMASGDFDFVAEQNLGLFQSIGDNLNQVRSGFKKAVEEEMKSQSMKTQLITNVSHDLKTPLTSIISYAHLLKQNDLDSATQKEYIDVIYRKSQRLNVLIQDLFDASKASSGNIDLHLEQLNILSLFHQAIGEMEDKFAEKNLQVKLRLLGGKAEPSGSPQAGQFFSQEDLQGKPSSAPRDPQAKQPPASGDAPLKQPSGQKLYCLLDGRQTSRIFENIISNIIKYALPSSRVYVDVESKNGYVSFTFKNISNYEMNFDVHEIAQRFTRGDAARSTEGSGLGLSIAKSLTELQHGLLEIKVDGDLFKLTLAFPQSLDL